MRFFRKIAGVLGFGSHNEGHDNKDEDDDNNSNSNSNSNNNSNHGNSDDVRRNRMNVDPIPAGPRRGFSVPVQVPVERHVMGPILVPCAGDGGVQGLKWYAARLKADEDGDVADEFLYEVPPVMSSTSQNHTRSLPRFQVKYNARQAKIQHQVLTPDGKLQHCVESQGQLQWV